MAMRVKIAIATRSCSEVFQWKNETNGTKSEYKKRLTFCLISLILPGEDLVAIAIVTLIAIHESLIHYSKALVGIIVGDTRTGCR